MPVIGEVKTGFWVTVGVIVAIFAVGLLVGLVSK